MRVRAAMVIIALGIAVTPRPGGADSLADRGKYLVEVLGACGNCHTPKGPAGNLPGKHLAGGFEITEEFGTAVASNITPDRETGIGAWSDAEVIRAIREGKSRDGRTLGPPMPFYLYRDLSDVDVKAMVAYLRTVTPVRSKVERGRYKIPLPPSWGPPVKSVPAPSKNDPLKYGAYLAGPVAHCADCHTPMGPDGKRDRTRLFAGGFAFTGPWGTTYSSNLTPDKETGIGRLSDAQIVAAIYGVHPDGAPVLPPMPWPYYAGKIGEGDVKALVAYLRSLKPVKNPVPAAKPR